MLYCLQEACNVMMVPPIRADLIAYRHISVVASHLLVGDLVAAEWVLDQEAWSVVCVLEDPPSWRYEGEHRFHSPIIVNGQVEPGLLNRAANWIEAQIAMQRPVLVHCAAGVERSPLAAAWTLARRLPWPPEVALATAYGAVKRARPLTEDRTVWLPKGWEAWLAST